MLLRTDDTIIPTGGRERYGGAVHNVFQGFSVLLFEWTFLVSVTNRFMCFHLPPTIRLKQIFCVEVSPQDFHSDSCLLYTSPSPRD